MGKTSGSFRRVIGLSLSNNVVPLLLRYHLRVEVPRKRSFFSTRHGSHRRYKYMVSIMAACSQAIATTPRPLFTLKYQICVQRRGLPETIRVSKSASNPPSFSWSFLHVTILFDLLQRQWCFQTRRHHYFSFSLEVQFSRFICVHRRGRPETA